MEAVKRIQANTEELGEQIKRFGDSVKETRNATNFPIMIQVDEKLQGINSSMRNITEDASEALRITKQYNDEVYAASNLTDDDAALKESLDSFGN